MKLAKSPVLPADGRLTWSWIAAMEPGLLDLAHESWLCAPDFDSDDYWPQRAKLKRRLSDLVGRYCSHSHPVMHSIEAYELAEAIILGGYERASRSRREGR